MTIHNMRSTPRTDATGVAREALERLETAWNNGDGEAFGNSYTTDASFVTIRGEHIVGSQAIGAGHAGIFGSIYAGSVNQMQLVRASEIADGVVLAVSVNTLDSPTGPLEGRHQAMSTSVVEVDAEGVGSIVSTHNTLITG
jgi:uncharacterized protein (TIGR02246 family)